jgi:hypothetical protein
VSIIITSEDFAASATDTTFNPSAFAFSPEGLPG